MPTSAMRRDISIILGVGLVYRLLFLAKRQLWTDELMQALVVRSDSAAAMLDRLRGGIILSTPLDPLIQKAAVFSLGEFNWVLRLHAAVFGALSLWFFFRIARFLFGDRVALYSTALFAVYPLHHHYSQEGLPHSLLTFLTLLSFDLLLRLVARSHNGWRGWLPWLCVEILLLFAGFAGIAVLLSQCAGLILSCSWRLKSQARSMNENDGEGKPDVPRASLRAVLTFVPCAALACALFWPWAHFAWAAHAAAYSESLNGRLILRILKELGDGSYPVTGMLILGVAIGITAMLRHGRYQSLLWFASWFAFPFPVVFLLDRWAGSPFILGQMLPFMPPLLLIAGYGLSYLGERLSILERPPFRLSSPALVYAAAFAVMSIVIAQYHWRREPVDWLGTARFLQATLRAGDTLTVPRGLPLLEYYVPALAGSKSADLSPGPVTSAAGQATRRIVVCLDSSKPDPCASFRSAATKDRAWSIREFSGLTVLIREK